MTTILMMVNGGDDDEDNQVKKMMIISKHSFYRNLGNYSTGTQYLGKFQNNVSSKSFCMQLFLH